MEEIESKFSELNEYISYAKAKDKLIERMEGELASERAKRREAEAEAKAAEARANAERARLEQSQQRSHAFEQRVADMKRTSERAMERAATSPSDEVTWCAAEVEEMEQQIGELTEQVRKFKQMEREYQRNKSAVNNFRVKYAEISSLRSENRELQREVARLEAERERVDEGKGLHEHIFSWLHSRSASLQLQEGEPRGKDVAVFRVLRRGHSPCNARYRRQS
jgi:DNA repair exonuclease SbcCD ATPase subunit